MGDKQGRDAVHGKGDGEAGPRGSVSVGGGNARDKAKAYDDSFERAIDEFELAQELTDEFEDPEGWMAENPNYWKDGAAAEGRAQRQLRLQGILARLGGMWTKVAEGRGPSRLDGVAHATETEPAAPQRCPARRGPRPSPSWRDAAYAATAVQEAKLAFFTRRLAELWERLLGVERGMSRLEEASRTKVCDAAWSALLDGRPTRSNQGNRTSADSADGTQGRSDPIDEPHDFMFSAKRDDPCSGTKRPDRPVDAFRLDADGWHRPHRCHGEKRTDDCFADEEGMFAVFRFTHGPAAGADAPATPAKPNAEHRDEGISRSLNPLGGLGGPSPRDESKGNSVRNHRL